MSAERDLAIARACTSLRYSNGEVKINGYPPTNADLRAIIAQVNASLGGGDASDPSDGQLSVPAIESLPVTSGASGIDESSSTIGQGASAECSSRMSGPPAQAAEPPSDLPSICCQMCAAIARAAAREAKREAVWLIRELVELAAHYPKHPAVQHGRLYIAAAEADAAEKGTA